MKKYLKKLGLFSIYMFPPSWWRLWHDLGPKAFFQEEEEKILASFFTKRSLTKAACLLAVTKLGQPKGSSFREEGGLIFLHSKSSTVPSLVSKWGQQFWYQWKRGDMEGVWFIGKKPIRKILVIKITDDKKGYRVLRLKIVKSNWP